MTRHTFDNREVAHIWANDRKTVRHGQGNGSIYFDGDTIYSYGNHFPIASFIERPDGKGEAVLFTTRSYSITTAKHISYVRGALHGHDIPILNVEDPSSRDWRSMALAAIKSAGEQRAKAARRRNEYMRSYDLKLAARDMEGARLFASWAKMKLPASDEAAMAEIARLADKAAKAAAKEQTKRRKEAERRALAREALWEEAKPYWRRREDYPQHIREAGLGYNFHGHSVALRLSSDGEEIETSQSARFPVAHGIRAFAVLKAIWQRGENWHANGHTMGLGHYAIEQVTAKGVKAGCHFVPRAEVELMAETLGIADIAPAATLSTEN